MKAVIIIIIVINVYMYIVCAGTGKTTFIRMLAGGLKPDGGGE